MPSTGRLSLRHLRHLSPQIPNALLGSYTVGFFPLAHYSARCVTNRNPPAGRVVSGLLSHHGGDLSGRDGGTARPGYWYIQYHKYTVFAYSQTTAIFGILFLDGQPQREHISIRWYWLRSSA